MHRLIMTSTVYRQSSRRESGQDRRRLRATLCYGRYPVRRLDAEALRDAILLRERPARPQLCTAHPCRSPRTPSAMVLPGQRLAAAEPLSPGPPDEAGLAAGDVRRSGR